MRIAICDDMPDQVGQIVAALDRYLELRTAKPQVFTFCNPLALLDSIESTGGYDIVLLDICMPGILGTEVAKEIRERGDKTEIVFLTTSNEYAVYAFSLKAAHYLVKPFSEEQFREAMDRALERFSGGEPRGLAVKPKGGGVRMVDVDDIVYVESHAHVLTIVTKSGSCTEAQRSLERIFEELEKVSPGQFVMPYKGYIVNQKAISAIEPGRIILRGGASVPVPRGSFRILKNAYFDYMFGSGLQS